MCRCMCSLFCGCKCVYSCVCEVALKRKKKTLLLGACMRVCVFVTECVSRVYLHNRRRNAWQTAFFSPPLAVNSLHSQDLRATRNESAQPECVMYPRALLSFFFLFSFLQHSPEPFQSVPASNSWLLFLKCC